MLIESSTIAPHGGNLVDRRAPGEDRKVLVREALGLPRVPLDARALSDLQMIASGVFSPLEGQLSPLSPYHNARRCRPPSKRNSRDCAPPP
jgi:hypothetical protein